MTTRALLPITADSYERHPVHAHERIWSETNCYVDLWIELLNALGLDPLAAGAFTLSTDFEGDQWTFFKFPPEDLRTLYGIDVSEMNVWRPLLNHVEEQLDFGRLLTVEADSFYLPDTAGVGYRMTHAKSTIVPQSVDRAGRRLGYFHNAGYYELSGDDFDGVFRSGVHADPDGLPPYVESVRLDRLRRELSMDDVRALTRDHLRRRPVDNPIVRLGQRLADDAQWLAAAGMDAFHLYAFGTCRQCGASAEFTAAFAQWLAAHGEPGMERAAGFWTELAEQAKTLQLRLARVARGRTVQLDDLIAAMAGNWADGMDAFVERFGS